MPMSLREADDGSGHYGRKAVTCINDMYLEDAPGVNCRINPGLREQLATVAVAGVVAELLVRGQRIVGKEVCEQLQIGRNQDDRRLFLEILCMESLTIESALPRIECATSKLLNHIAAIQAAVPQIVAKIILETPDHVTWAHLKAYLCF
jgi:hypothetical protein